MRFRILSALRTFKRANCFLSQANCPLRLRALWRRKSSRGVSLHRRLPRGVKLSLCRAISRTHRADTKTTLQAFSVQAQAITSDTHLHHVKSAIVDFLNGADDAGEVLLISDLSSVTCSHPTRICSLISPPGIDSWREANSRIATPPTASTFCRCCGLVLSTTSSSLALTLPTVSFIAG